MRKEEIIAKVAANDSTVLSFPDRGSWGDKNYRGNCSGWIHAFLAWKYQVKKMAELFSGSGTGYDVCKDLGIEYVGADLNPNPVRPGILCTDAITDEVPDEFRDADFLFSHPAYSSLIGISWAGKFFNDPDGKLASHDLGNMPWEPFMQELNRIIMKFYSAMPAGGRMGLLVGDIRRQGKFYSMAKELVIPGELEQIIIKMQHNCVSNGRTYTHKNFVPIIHEYIMVLKKIAPYLLDFSYVARKKLDIRDSVNATWKDVVLATMQKLKSSNLNGIYAELENHDKAKANPNWKSKIRQVLQQLREKGLLKNPVSGTWMMAA